MPERFSRGCTVGPLFVLWCPPAYMIGGRDFELPEYILTDVSRRNLEEALDPESSNAEFYFCAAAREDNVADATMFKCLDKLESECFHNSQGIEKTVPDLSRDRDMFSGIDLNNVKESNQWDTNVIGNYSLFPADVTEERIKEIFTAIIEIEKNHLSLTEGRF